MLATVLTSLVHGLEGRLVEVQVDVSAGVSGFTLVGLASGAVREALDRVRSAIRNSGLPFPQRRLTVNLAPAGLRKDGPALDLANTSKTPSCMKAGSCAMLDSRGICRPWQPSPKAARTVRSERG